MTSLVTARRMGLALLAFLILASYEAARPPVESLFLARHGAEALPTVWLLVAGGALATVAAYNLLAARMALVPLLALCTVISGALLAALLVAARSDLPGHGWALYVWKDLYIVVLIESFWALVNVTSTQEEARWTYGALLVAGTLGSLAGGTLAGRVAAEYGLGTTLWLALPILGGVLVAVRLLRGLDSTGAAARPQETRRTASPEKTVLLAHFKESLAVLAGSPYLGLLVATVVLVQLTTTLVDYGYNGIIASAYPDATARTVVISDVYRAINIAALALQLGAGFLLTFGLSRVFVAVPLLVGGTVLALALHPVFIVAALAKVVGKSLDYSLFRACKEMLYIPMSYAEKTQGKAVVDILGYRVAKGGAALALQGLVLLGLATWSAWLAAALVLGWVGLAVAISRRHRRLG